MSSPDLLKATGNYSGLLLAGAGSVGRAMLLLGCRLLDSFAKIVIVDHRPLAATTVLDERMRFLQGDIEDPAVQRAVVGQLPPDSLLVNCCGDIDNVRLRHWAVRQGYAYLDSCCCAPAGCSEVRFSRMMPYSFSEIVGPLPQWICWGINPGVVELIVRQTIGQMGGGSRYDVAIFEHDELTVDQPWEKTAVGWNVSAMVEETMESPTLVIEDGRAVEETTGGAVKVLARWGEVLVPSRLVGHEDIWNLGRRDEIDNAVFVYGLSPQVMAVLDARSPAGARRQLAIPPAELPLSGRERVAVMVRDRVSGETRTRLWLEDHGKIWQRWQLNAVQYQTAKSVLLALALLQQTDFGNRPGIWCGSDLPISGPEWSLIGRIMADLDIRWQEADDLNLTWWPQEDG